MGFLAMWAITTLIIFCAGVIIFLCEEFEIFRIIMSFLFLGFIIAVFIYFS